jgi:hypothetical protein
MRKHRSIARSIVRRFGPEVPLLCALVWCGCGETGGAQSEPMSVITGKGARQISLAGNGDLIGPTLSIAPTAEGYRGMADSAIIDLRCDGARIRGTMFDRIVDLHLFIEEQGMRLQGMLAGRLGRLEASNQGIKSTLGRCSYELTAVSHRYEGQRACVSGVRVPVIGPVAVELPPGFARLPSGRQAMLLAILFAE